MSPFLENEVIWMLLESKYGNVLVNESDPRRIERLIENGYKAVQEKPKKRKEDTRGNKEKTE